MLTLVSKLLTEYNGRGRSKKQGNNLASGAAHRIDCSISLGGQQQFWGVISLFQRLHQRKRRLRRVAIYAVGGTRQYQTIP